MHCIRSCMNSGHSNSMQRQSQVICCSLRIIISCGIQETPQVIRAVLLTSLGVPGETQVDALADI